ncbi:MAG: hypothetical protein H7A23_23055 [Leptospiraceae bacterium]|nr:hypothetical protein [Leptospiraceae bacterium]MCP5497445.1 hypothetical protein [Leptospiraceae bacterium]
MKSTFYIILTIFLLGSCDYLQRKNIESTQYYNDCMETFKDEQKCKSLVEKAQKSEEQNENISKEVYDNLKIRDEVKDTIQDKNKLFVIKYLGEPDERKRSSSGLEFFIYKRPISKYSKNSKPDKELKIVFNKNGLVQKVFHKSP